MEQHPPDISDLKAFVEELRADRAETRAATEKDAWTRYVSLSLVCIAVLTAVATQWSGKYTTQTLSHLSNSTFLQSKASNHWAFYQAKSIKQNVYQLQREVALGAGPDGARLAEEFGGKAAIYEKEKLEIKAQAEVMEKDRDEARELAAESSKRGSNMGLAVSIFQIAVALGGICVVLKKRWLWYTSLTAGAVATLQMVYTWVI